MTSSRDWSPSDREAQTPPPPGVPMEDGNDGRTLEARMRLLRHRLRTAIICRDLYLVYMRVSPRWKAFVVRPNTEIVIEGYPRSGNTFAQVAFELAQGRPVQIAHHTHAPAQVRWAVKHRIPTVLLIRPAEDAIVSHVIRDPYLPLGQALSDWILFYQTLLPWRDQMVIAEFAKVTSGLGEVVRRVNRDYGTRFAIFENSEENIARCYQAIEELFRKRWHRAQVDEIRVPRPSASRSPLKEALQTQLVDQELSRPLERAHALYKEFLDARSVVS